VVAGLDDVQVVPGQGGRTPGAGSVLGRVRERSAPPAGPAGFWPFPDLAFVELVDWTDHEVAPLAAIDSPVGGRVHAWGFGRREEGMDPVGTPASYEMVGEDGDGYLQLQAGEVQRGMSGAPVVCCTHAAVFGLISVSRDLGQPRGGWMSPLRTLEPGEAPDPLIERVRLIREANRAAAWRSRTPWSCAVGGADFAGLVDQPWLHLTFGSGMPPSLLLRAEYLTVDFGFRDQALDSAVSWCEQAAPLAVARITAAGGAGKTRFGIELCRAMAERAWVCGFLPRRDRGLRGAKRPRLVVVDYFDERDAPELADSLGQLAQSASAMFPVRVLLLARPNRMLRVMDLEESLRMEAKGALAGALELVLDQSTAAAAIQVGERRELFGRGYVAYSKALFGAEHVGVAPERDLSADRFGAPFDVLLEAFDAAHGGPLDLGPAAIDRALDHERRHWQARDPDIGIDSIRAGVALATLATAPAQRDAGFLLDLACGPGVETRSKLDLLIAGLYEGPRHWNPLRPDRLGEALIIDVFNSLPDQGLGWITHLLAIDNEQQLEHSLDVLTRLGGALSRDHQLIAVARDALLERHVALVDRSEQQTISTASREGHTALLTSLSRAHSALIDTAALASLNLEAKSALSRSFDRLGALATRCGRSEEARAIFQHAYELGLALPGRGSR